MRYVIDRSDAVAIRVGRCLQELGAPVLFVSADTFDLSSSDVPVFASPGKYRSKWTRLDVSQKDVDLRKFSVPVWALRGTFRVAINPAIPIAFRCADEAILSIRHRYEPETRPVRQAKVKKGPEDWKSGHQARKRRQSMAAAPAH